MVEVQPKKRSGQAAVHKVWKTRQQDTNIVPEEYPVEALD